MVSWTKRSPHYCKEFTFHLKLLALFIRCTWCTRTLFTSSFRQFKIYIKHYQVAKNPANCKRNLEFITNQQIIISLFQIAAIKFNKNKLLKAKWKMYFLALRNARWFISALHTDVLVFVARGILTVCVIICYQVYKCSLQIQGQLTASLATVLQIMDETGTDFSQSNIVDSAWDQSRERPFRRGNGGINFPSPGFQVG